MKALKLALLITVTLLLLTSVNGFGQTFHSGGVADCDGCHTMHNSFQNTAVTTAYPQYQAGPYLLRGTTQSETCLTCHATTPAGSSYHIMDNTIPSGTNGTTPPGNYTPGGDFAWLKMTFTWSPQTGTSSTSLGDRHGHNVVAPAFGIIADATNTTGTAPGGTYPAASLHCSSCHDPHGRYRRDASGNVGTPTIGTTKVSLPIWASGSYYNGTDVTRNEPTPTLAVGVYRLLGGNGYQPVSLSGNFAFSADPPAAKVNSTYQAATGEQTTQYRVAYGAGMSEWCANCHVSMHRDITTVGGASGLSHPSGNGAKLGATIAGNYNAYVKTGTMSGVQATSGSTLVPFEIGSTDYAGTLAPLAINTTYAVGFAGPDPAGTSANVACVSCHRAHASGFDSILRFSIGSEFMTVADSGGNPIWPDPTANPSQAMGRTTTVMQAAYYNRLATQFAPFQRVLCNKCHAKD